MSPLINENTAWCRAITARLSALGVQDAVVCPGARSAAMVSALGESGQYRLFVQTDERSAAFFALGLARSTGRPAAICVTSGSAVANLVPALSEAYALGLPLVVLSCDRPKRLRTMGLPQTTRQVDFCRPVVEAALDLEDPSPDDQALSAAIAAIEALAPHLRPGPQQGPVQINIPLSGKMSSVDGVHGWKAGSERTAEMPIAPVPAAPQSDIAALLAALAAPSQPKGLIVVGPDSHGVGPEEIRLLAESTGYPVIADAPGSVRGLGIPHLVAEADFLVSRPEVAKAPPNLVIRIGSAPVSASLQHYVQAAQNQEQPAKVLRINSRPVEGDFLAPSFIPLISPAAEAVRTLAAGLPQGDAEWRRNWMALSQTCRQRLQAALPETGWSELVAVAEAIARPAFSFIHCANSLSLRLINLLLPASGDGRPVYLNRGVSGIDGTIGTFLGEAAGEGRRGLLLVGDLAAIHDIPAFEACLHQGFAGAVLVLNNSGAGLFDLLPVRTVPSYERLIRNPARIDFSGIAQAFGLGFSRCESIDELRQALDRAERDDRLHVIEAMVPAGGAPAIMARLLSRLAAPV
jgi:2-succinyl-5-enolpyruvyl-6-hydroxy-3-cyclohexene-1-carboxylate synthase